MRKKAFLLLDSLMIVVIVAGLVVTLWYLFDLHEKYVCGYIDYRQQSNEKLEALFLNIDQCCPLAKDLPADN